MNNFKINADVIKTEVKVSINYDNALNDAGWILINAIGRYQEVSPALFNNMKGCLKEAIEAYLEATIKENK